ncbi:MAG: outer membrane receptor protein involved in Fe transport [Verrucomicrobiales bacterium]|jgi:outer membrane receptor protein involved in Fe transport
MKNRFRLSSVTSGAATAISIAGLATSLLVLPLVSAQESTEESFIPNYTAASVYGSWTDSATFDGGGNIDLYELSATTDLPLIMRDEFKLTAGVRYRYNAVDFDGSDTVFASQSLDLHRLEIPANLWIDRGKWKFWMRFQPGVASDFEEFDSDAFTITALGLASYKLSDKLSIAGGVYYSQDLGESRVLPALGLIWRPTPQWSLALTVPRLQIAYAPTRKWLLTLNAYPNGGSWNIEDPDGEGKADLNHSAIRAGIGIDHQIGDTPAWIFLDAGMQFLQELELDGSTENFTHDIDEAVFVNFGLKLRF